MVDRNPLASHPHNNPVTVSHHLVMLHPNLSNKVDKTMEMPLHSSKVMVDTANLHLTADSSNRPMETSKVMDSHTNSNSSNHMAADSSSMADSSNIVANSSTVDNSSTMETIKDSSNSRGLVVVAEAI